MKTTLAILLLSVCAATAATVRFEWDPSPDHVLITNYVLYISTNPAPTGEGWTQKYDALRATNVTTIIPKGGWFCYVLSEGTNAVSEPSNVLGVRVLSEVSIKVKF